jgi:hypothetical protein
LTDNTGELTGTRRDATPRTYRSASSAGSFSMPLLGGTLRANGEVERWNFRTTLDSFGFNSVGAATDAFSLGINERQREREFGGDYEHRFGAWTLKLIGLDSTRLYANDEQTISYNGAAAQTAILR